jgi:hypothetical protein
MGMSGGENRPKRVSSMKRLEFILGDWALVDEQREFTSAEG